MKKLILACVVALALSPVAMAHEIAISTQAGWFGQAAADREMQEIVDNVAPVPVEVFPADQQDALADWVVAHTGDGIPDLLILCGQFPPTIYPGGNAQPDGSIAELFLDDGNIIVNTGDYMFYVCSAGNNAAGGLENMMDIPGISMWDDNTPVVVTADGLAITPSLADFETDRPFHLDQLTGAWFAELVLAQNDAGTRADAVIVASAETGGRLGIFYQTASQDDDPRGEVISEWINNWYLTVGPVVSPGFPALSPNPPDGEVDVTSPLFEWTPGYGAASHDVYVGTTPELTDADFKGNQGFTMYFFQGVLEPGVTYYWRIDEVDADGNKATGDVWSFTVFPIKATEPSPPDGATNAPLVLDGSWKAGNGAVSHDVYGAPDEAAVAAGVADALLGTVSEAQLTVPDLDPDTTYYWRVDEIDALGNKVVGDVWSFTTVGAVACTAEPNLIGAWTFDTEDASSMMALDTSCNDNHGVIKGAITFETDADMGAVLKLPGGDNQFVDIGAVGLSGNDPTTIACWAKADHTSIPDWTLIFGFTGTADGSGGSGSHFNIGSLGGPGGVGAHVWGWEETIFDDNTALEWHHYAMTYDGTTITYYGDGVEKDTDAGKSNVRDLAIRGDRVHIGSRVTQASSFPGDVDDCRIYDRVLTAEEIRLIGSDVTLPWDPDPVNGASGLPSDTVLSWNAGDGAVEQDVYIGLDAAAVADANASDATGIYLGRQAETAYAPILAADTTYYWRVDQVDADGNIVVAPVWSFGTARGIPAEANLGACPTDVPGFLIRSLQAQVEINNFNEMNEILDTGMLEGLPPVEGSEGTRIDEFVNVRDTGNGAFSEANGYPDASFPGIDALEVPAQDPADGDDENDFATEIRGCIHLTAGMHEIGTATDDGVIVWIGGIEIGRSGELKGASNADLPPFFVEEDGYYSLRARTFERGGGASAELHELLPDGTRILLNDVANGGSAVFAPADAGEPELVAAFAFGSRDLVCPTYNVPSVNYTMVLHVNNEPGTIQYDAALGYGYEVVYPEDSPFGSRSGFGIFGPFDNSANNRNEFGDDCPDQLYDSFIGAKDFSSEVSAATMGDMDTPSASPEGLIFRVDVPNGLYRFVAAVGEADNGHAHRILAEDGGSGPPANIGRNYVVLVHNHDQSQFDLNPDMDETGDGVFARVGFDGLIPPEGDGVAPDPVFVDMGYNGRPGDFANSPVLEVNQGCIRIHQLQGNSNDGPGGTRDPNGGDIVILELWKVG